MRFQGPAVSANLSTYLTQVCTNVSGTEYSSYWSIGDRGFIGFSFKNAANVTPLRVRRS